MDLATLTAELVNRGLTPTLAGGKLAIAGPADQITPVLKAGLTKHRVTLRAMLAPAGESQAKSESIVSLPGLATPAPGADSLPPENANGLPDLAFADTPEADAGLRKVGAYFDDLAADVRANNPKHAGRMALDLNGDPCRVCGFEPTVLSLIHDGDSIRRDCATCGAFVEFPAWGNASEWLRDEIAKSRAEPACEF